MSRIGQWIANGIEQWIAVAEFDSELQMRLNSGLQQRH
jgi:hypothetical protein